MRHADRCCDSSVDFGDREAKVVRLLNERDLQSKADVTVQALIASEPRKSEVEWKLNQVKQNHFRIVAVNSLFNVGEVE